MKRKTILLCWMLTATLLASAKIVKLTLADGTVRAFASSQLSSIEIDEEGMMVLTGYDGEVIDSLDADLSTLEVTDEPIVYESVGRDMTFADENLLTTRKVYSLNMLYPSVDPDGNPITLSGAIHIPEEILLLQESSKGVMLVSHSTISNKNECPTKGFLKVESMMLAYYTKPQYIVVESDFYGFGATERFPQAYLFGLTNAQATVDALEAARKLLPEYGLSTSGRLFNIGYSSGCYDAVGMLRLVEEKYADRIKIDHTMVGAGPMNILLMYNKMAKEDSTDYAVAMPMVVVSYNESAHLELDYNKVFQPMLASKLDDWILSKKYSTMELCDSIGTHHLSEIFMPDFLAGSDGHQQMINLMDKNSMVKGWKPSTDNRIFYYHGTNDEIVQQECGKSFVDFLKDCGFTQKSFGTILSTPDLDANLLTTYVPILGHIKGAAVYARQVQKIVSEWDKTDDDKDDDKE